MGSPGFIAVWSVTFGLLFSGSICIDRMAAWLLWASRICSLTVLETNPSFEGAYYRVSSKALSMLDPDKMWTRTGFGNYTLCAILYDLI